MVCRKWQVVVIFIAVLAAMPVAAQSNAALFANTPSTEAKGGSGDIETAEGAPASLPGVGDLMLPPLPDPVFATPDPALLRLNAMEIRALPDPVIKVEQPPRETFQTRAFIRQSFEYLMVQHVFREAMDPSLRYQLVHSRFFYNWFASYQGYNLKRFSDGDDFIVNEVGHPLQGAVASRIFLQNNPTGSRAIIGKDPKYWTSRLKGLAWAAAFEVQWKVGPLSETSLGNAGGWEYVPGCGFTKVCIDNPKHPNPPTNNTGWSDWVLTPVIGTFWVMAEDTIDKYVAAKIAVNHPVIGGKILRTALEPSRSFAGLFMGKLPWQFPDADGSYFVKPNPKPQSANEIAEANAWKQQRRSFGIHYANVNLPGAKEGCIGCREYNGGIGVGYGYRFFKYVYFDGEVNYFGGGSDGGPTLEGLFGAKVGHQGKNWGLFGKVRPGFIYYEKAWTGGQSAKWDDLSRFVWDTGGVFEVYPSKRSTLRLDVGTTIVRYLRDYPNEHLSQIQTYQSSDYYVNQGNFQISSGYTVRF